MRVTSRKTERNNKLKTAFRTAVKKVVALVDENKVEEAKKAFKDAQKKLDKAAKSGVIKQNAASRKKSRLSKKIKKSEKK